jgi:hypothetical protein
MKAIIELINTFNSFSKPIDNNLNLLPLTEANSHIYFIRYCKSISKWQDNSWLRTGYHSKKQSNDSWSRFLRVIGSDFIVSNPHLYEPADSITTFSNCMSQEVLFFGIIWNFGQPTYWMYPNIFQKIISFWIPKTNLNFQIFYAVRDSWCSGYTKKYCWGFPKAALYWVKKFCFEKLQKEEPLSKFNNVVHDQL